MIYLRQDSSAIKQGQQNDEPSACLFSLSPTDRPSIIYYKHTDQPLSILHKVNLMIFILLKQRKTGVQRWSQSVLTVT